jgi:hypothetical protein
MIDQPSSDEQGRGLNRRQVLGIGAGLGVLGAAAIGGVAHAADGSALGARDAPLVPATVPATTAGMTYQALGIYDFFTTNNLARAISAERGVYPATSPATLASTGLHLPVGAILKEWVVWASNVSGFAFNVLLRGYLLDGSGVLPLGLLNVVDGTATPTMFAGSITGGTHVVRPDLQYNVESFMPASGSSQLYGARFGYQAPAQFYPISPVRAYDSRQAAYPVNGALAPNTSRVISIKDAHDSGGGVAIVDVVPVGASAVAFNVTVTGPTGPNFLSITPGDAATYIASTINFPAGDDRAVGGVVQVDSARQIKIFCGNQGGSTHVIIDISGYYL